MSEDRITIDPTISLSKTELLTCLKSLAEDDASNRYTDGDHLKADRLLLQYIRDVEVVEAFNAIRRWYA